LLGASGAGRRLKQVRTGESIALHAPQFSFAREREIADEAFVGDVVGIANHGTLRIGDALTEGGDISCTRAPYSDTEINRRVR
jgi:peptide chain release factor 3